MIRMYVYYMLIRIYISHSLTEQLELSAPSLTHLFDRVVQSGADAVLSPEQQLQHLMQARAV